MIIFGIVGCDTNNTDNTIPRIDSITIHSSVYTDNPVTLNKGLYQAPAAPGSASMITVKLTDKKAFTTINDNVVGVVVLVTETGGTGTFYELALLSKQKQGWVNTDTVLLGDREKVQSVAIDSGHVFVDMITHAPSDPLCCPTLKVTKLFSVKGGRLVPVNDGSETRQASLSGTRWQWSDTHYNNDNIVTPSKPKNYTISFGENGQFDIKSDCNLKGGQYKVEGNQLSIRILNSTMAACGPDSLEEEYVQNLAASAIYFFKDGDLYIDLMYDTGTMRFTRLH